MKRKDLKNKYAKEKSTFIWLQRLIESEVLAYILCELVQLTLQNNSVGYLLVHSNLNVQTLQVRPGKKRKTSENQRTWILIQEIP